MNTIITQVSEAIQKILTTTADQLAETTRFVKRRVKVTGSNFSQTLVFGWLRNPSATLEELCQTAIVTGLEITPQGLEQRFTEEACHLMKGILDETLTQAIKANEVTVPILQKFKGVHVMDSSTVQLPEELAQIWTGCGNGSESGKAAVKLEVRLDLLSGEIDGPILTNGRTNDRKVAKQHKPLVAGSLIIADLGYWRLDTIADYNRRGVYWVSRAQIQTSIYDQDGQKWTLTDLIKPQQGQQLDIKVTLGARHHLPARLIAVRLPLAVADQRRRKMKKHARDKGKTVSQDRLFLAGWTLFFTNVPASILSITETLALGRIRWQIELLFKLWKS